MEQSEIGNCRFPGRAQRLQACPAAAAVRRKPAGPRLHPSPRRVAAPHRVAACGRLLAESWLDRLERHEIGEEPSRPGRATCDWLYQNVTFDSADRVMPCCMAPTNVAHVHYGTQTGEQQNLTNNDGFRRARLAFADSDAYDAEA